MASETHIDEVFPSGSLCHPHPFMAKTRMVLCDNSVGIFLQFGHGGCSDNELQAITLTPQQVRDLRTGLANALGNIGEWPLGQKLPG